MFAYLYCTTLITKYIYEVKYIIVLFKINVVYRVRISDFNK